MARVIAIKNKNGIEIMASGFGAMNKLANLRRRKFASLFIAPKPLAMISIPFLFLIAITLAIVIAIHWKVLHALEQVELFGVENLPAMNALHQVQSSVTVIGAVGIGILAVAC